MGTPTSGSTPADCCASCLALPGCGSFTFTAPGGSACYSHPVGALGDNNAGSDYTSGICYDDAVDYNDPRVLVNATASRTGVPLGGIGVGFVDITPDGSFGRVAINNWHQDGVLTDTFNGSFFAAWTGTAAGGKAQLLQRRPIPNLPTLPPATSTTYSGMFPVVDLVVDSAISVRAWSPLIPHDIQNSSLPLVYIDVTISNPTDTAAAAAVAFSWQDVIGRALFDASKAQLDAHYGSDPACGFATDQLRNNMAGAGIDVAHSFPRVPTFAAYETNAGTSIFGVRQRSAAPLSPNKYTLQNYNHAVGVVVDALASGLAPGDVISYLPAYSVNSVIAASAAWAPFVSNGTFGLTGGFAQTPLHTLGGSEAASAVAVRIANVPPHGARTIRFMLSWYGAELLVQPGQDPRTTCGTTSYSRMYHNRFIDLAPLLAFGAAARGSLYSATTMLPDALAQTSIPGWLQFKIANSHYTLFTNTLLTKDGRFSVMEGGMGGLAGTMDQRLVAHPWYAKFMTATDAQELLQFGVTQAADGSISHFDADFYAGITGTDGVAPLGGQEYHDNTMSFIIQLAMRYRDTGDLDALLKHEQRLAPAVNFIVSTVPTGSPFFIPGGSNTYDDFWELPIDAYMGSLGPTFFNAAYFVATALGNVGLAQQCLNMSHRGAADFTKALYTGQFFAYGCEVNGTGRHNDIMFNGQVAGSFLQRLAMFNDTIPFEQYRSATAAQLRTSVAASHGFYAPKVYNLSSQSRARDPRNNNPSSTWPFYLESYTALAAIQTGYLDDGLALLKHIQLTNLALGLAWSQNLWNPGFITYVAAPVSWFTLDVLAGAALNVPDNSLYLSPILRGNETGPVVIPLFYPRFWARVNATAATRELTLTITHTFELGGGMSGPISLRRIGAVPAGTPTASMQYVDLATPFVCTAGAVLDLSAHWSALIGAVLQPSVLPADPP